MIPHWILRKLSLLGRLPQAALVIEKTFVFKLVVVLAAGLNVAASQTSTINYVYDDNDQLVRALDAHGNSVRYVYDSASSLLQIITGQSPGISDLAVFGFAPGSGGTGATITIQGQNFDLVASKNAITFNGTTASVISATASTLVASVPTGATSGPVTVTVNGVTATSTDNFTVVSSPAVTAVNPKYAASSTAATTIPNFTLTGTNLTGSAFSFAPAFNPAPITVNSASISTDGASATLNLTVAAGVKGTFTLLATDAAGT